MYNADRSTLICSSLNNPPIYHMYIYLLPKTVVKDLDKVRRTFFWQRRQTKRKYHLLRWTKICKSKKKGGLGIKDIRKNEFKSYLQVVVELGEKRGPLAIDHQL